MPRAKKRARSGPWLALASLALVGLVGVGCGKKGLEQKECDALRVKAFELVNQAHACSTDADCTLGDWPVESNGGPCKKPVSKKHNDEIGKLKEQFSAGKCPEEKESCREPPASYCKQGLCVAREKASPGGGTTTDDIKLE